MNIAEGRGFFSFERVKIPETIRYEAAAFPGVLVGTEHPVVPELSPGNPEDLARLENYRKRMNVLLARSVLRGIPKRT